VAGGAVTAGFELALRVSLLALALDPPLLWFERLPVVLCAALGLAVPAALRAPALWLALAALSAWPIAWRWPFADNHEYLNVLWCLSLALALATRAPAALGAHYGRRLVGLVFLLASLWKLVLSPDFVDGRFFRMTLLSDARFEALAVAAGGMSFEEWAANDAAIDALITEQTPPEAFRLNEPPALRRLAWALTIVTGALEAALAVAFLAPLGTALARARDALLLAFLFTTFSFATVQGFGWLLVALGLAQCQGERWRTRAAYLAAFALVALYRAVPWTDWLI
jgi:hypothetical protein